MGCGASTPVEDVDQKKKSQMIDKSLEEDARRLRRECKILLLGKSRVLDRFVRYLILYRVWREWEVNNCQADENHTPEWLHC